jgi:hypothetical protein
VQENTRNQCRREDSLAANEHRLPCVIHPLHRAEADAVPHCCIAPVTVHCVYRLYQRTAVLPT